MNLQEFFAENPRVAIAFSGGVDSSYLLYAALHYGARARAYYVNSAFQPAFELEDARRLAGELNADMKVLPVDVLGSWLLVTLRAECLEEIGREVPLTKE